MKTNQLEYIKGLIKRTEKAEKAREAWLEATDDSEKLRSWYLMQATLLLGYANIAKLKFKEELEEQEEIDALCQICGTNKAEPILGDICGNCK